ncbi:MAG: glutathione S-transferase N-terminal domain-containing protein [Pseudomonadota bacterium]
MAHYILYGSDMSYFSGKARAYMRWKDVAFEEVTPTPDVMKTVLLPQIGWPVIPVVKTPDGRLVQDTSDIIDDIDRHAAGPDALPETPLQAYVSLLLQLFADEWLTLPAMHYRWNHNEAWIYGEFGKTTLPDAPLDAQRQAGEAVGGRFKSFVPQLGISDETIPGIEAAYEDFLSKFSIHLEDLPYLMGTRASLADFAMIGPLYAHLYRDPASGALMQAKTPRVADWVERVIAGKGRSGALLADDDIPASLLPILSVQMDEQLPVLQQTAGLLEDWAKQAAPESEVPRGLGKVPFVTGGHGGTCAARTFPLYRLQQAQDVYHQSNHDDRVRLDAFLKAIGGEALIGFELATRLVRRNYRLSLA